MNRLFPFGHGLRIDPVSFGQSSQALLTTLYRSTDRLCRGGAAVKNLAQSASLHAGENNAPSKPGTRHLARVVILTETDRGLREWLSPWCRQFRHPVGNRSRT